MVFNLFHIEHYHEVLYIRCGRPWYKTGFFYLGGLLIDCGPPRVAPAFRKFCQSHPVQACVLTHHHEDHAGNSAVLNEMGIYPFLTPRGMELFQSLPHRMKLYRRVTWGVPPKAEFTPLKGNTFSHGKYTFEIIPTPGHSQDHVCLWEPNRKWLFTGDLYISSRIQYMHAEEDVDDTLRSLDGLLQYPIEILFCAHRGGIKEGYHHLSEKLRILLELRDFIQHNHARGKSPKEILQLLKWKKDWMAWISGNDFSKEHLVQKLIKSTYRVDRDKLYTLKGP